MNDLIEYQQPQQQITLQDLLAIAVAASGAKSEQVSVVRKMLYARDNGFPLSLAVTGGLYIANMQSGRVGVEGKPLKNRIANDPNYHLQTVESTREKCTLQMWRKASELWPYAELYGEQYKAGSWVPIGEATFTMEEAKHIEMYAGGNKRPLAEKDTYMNFPQEMLHYRCIQRLVSLYGDGLFANPPILPGELPDDNNANIVEGELVRTSHNQPPAPVIDMDYLTRTYTVERVMAAMSAVGSNVGALYAYLKIGDVPEKVSPDELKIYNRFEE